MNTILSAAFVLAIGGAYVYKLVVDIPNKENQKTDPPSSEPS